MKKYAKILFERMGYRLIKLSKSSVQNSNPFLGCKSLINNIEPVIFDVGMNHGQTLNKIRTVFPQATIHGFEASKYCYQELHENFKDDTKIHLNNLAIGDEETVLQFNEYSWDAMNSFLTRAYGKTTIIETYDVNVTTIDAYCLKNNIHTIDILKSDTEGFELKVLQGAQGMMKKNKIKFVFVELFFDLNFIGQGSVGDIFSYLEQNNFSLVRFYDIGLTGHGLASKGDALFINTNFK